MSINDVLSIRKMTNFVIANLDNETKDAANEIKSLFSQKFYNGGDKSAAEIDEEIEKLQNQIEEAHVEQEISYNRLKLTNERIKTLNKEIQEEIETSIEEAEADSRRKSSLVNKAIDKVNEMYMNGEIRKDEMPFKLQQEIASICEGAPESVMQKISVISKSNTIKKCTNEIAEILTNINTAENESNLLAGTLELMKGLKNKMQLRSTDFSTGLTEKPIYTPTQQALIDQFAKGIKGLTKDGEYDKNSIDNPQVKKLEEFLGINGNGVVNDKGVLAASQLNVLKEAGFTPKQALYAINWIFDKSNMSYTPGGEWSVPYGHYGKNEERVTGKKSQANTIYRTLIDQVDKLWGKNAMITGDDGETSTDNDPGFDPDEDTTRTDPIGFAIDNTTFELVIDRDADQVFDGKSEFLGAIDGIDELKALDKDGNGKISKEELKINKNLYLVSTNHETGKHGFMNATEVIDEIDLTSIEAQNWTNINNNTVKNIFNITTTNDEIVKGYQTLDDDYYLSKSYNGINNAEMAVTVDENTMNKAEEHFSKIKEVNIEQAEEYKSANDIASEIDTTITNGTSELNKINKKTENYVENAQDGLTTAIRTHSAERNEEAEEAEEAEEEENKEEEIEE